MNVDEIFAAGGASRIGAVRWGHPVPLDEPGVYVVTADFNHESGGSYAEAPLNTEAIAELLRVRPGATVDGQAATPESVRERLQEMWIPGQEIVYIGRAGTSVRKRINQFYKTDIGARAPHAGGWPVKMLQSDLLWVHYAAAKNDEDTEAAMLEAFIAGVPTEARLDLVDPALPLPYANLQLSQGVRKQHGFKDVKASRIGLFRTRKLVSASPRADKAPSRVRFTKETPTMNHSISAKRTQNVTAGDIGRGALRIPSVSKSIFPEDKQKLTVQVYGSEFEASWDPKTAGDKERSGTIRLGKRFMEEHFTPSGPLRVELVDGIYVIS